MPDPSDGYYNTRLFGAQPRPVALLHNAKDISDEDVALLVVASNLREARTELQYATTNLAAVWHSEDHDEAIGRLKTALEATVRAISSVSLAVERLAAVPACEGVN